MNLTKKIKKRLTSERFLASAVFTFLVIIGAAGSATAQSVLQSYRSDEKLQRGMLVTLNKDDQTKIEAVTDKNLAKLKGVVADSNDSPVTLGGQGNIFVATTGIYEVLVSNENGKIKSGDYVSVSSLSGIGMKANDTQSVILGRATIDFDGGGDSVAKTEVSNGTTVSFGRITVDIGIGNNPLLKPPLKESVPNAIEEVANELAGKSVSAARVYLAITILLITAGVAGTTLFSGVRSTIIAVGRNPLSKGTIYKGLIQVVVISLIIFITGLFAVYLLVKL